MIKELLSDVFSKRIDLTDRLMALFLLICLLVVLALISLLVFWAADYWFTDNKSGQGVAISRDYTPTHTQVTSAGKTTSVIVIPESWDVKFKLQHGPVVSCGVSEAYYDRFEAGKVENISYSYGRFSGATYCNRVL